jgi:uncharacterized cupin superfamily protein
MSKVIRQKNADFAADGGKIDGYRIWTDRQRAAVGINPQWLNFDLKRLPAGERSSPFHFHRYAEELFLIVQGEATLRSVDGTETVRAGDMLFFEAGESGAHQLINETTEDCIFVDIRTFIGYDVCEYPDSGKVFLAPSYEVFRKQDAAGYFEGEEIISRKI